MSNQEVAHLIINFLKNAVKGNEVPEDYVDSLDVAIDCIADAFEVAKDDDEATVKKVFQGKTLSQIVDAAKSDSSAASTAGAAEVPVHVDEAEIDEETLARAEELKMLGNKAMSRKDFQEAVSKYTEALALTPKNKIYLSNRAAAYSSLRDQESAIADAKAAIEIDPTFSKAYSRLGLAYYASGKPKESMEAYKKGLEVEGDSPSDAMKKGYETAKSKVESSLDLEQKSTSDETSREAPSSAGAGAGGAGAGGMPDLAGLASMLGGGAGGAGGMPDLSAMMSNPMIAQMAQRMMSNPDMLNNLMSNPNIRDMANQFGNGGGMPDIGSLMSNPALRDMASQFMNPNSGSNGSNGSEGSN